MHPVVPFAQGTSLQLPLVIAFNRSKSSLLPSVAARLMRRAGFASSWTQAPLLWSVACPEFSHRRAGAQELEAGFWPVGDEAHIAWPRRMR